MKILLGCDKYRGLDKVRIPETNFFSLTVTCSLRSRKGYVLTYHTETMISCLLRMSQAGMEPITQACALIRNRTSNLSVCRTTPNQLSLTSQGYENSFDSYLNLVISSHLPSGANKEICPCLFPVLPGQQTPVYFLHENARNVTVMKRETLCLFKIIIINEIQCSGLALGT